MAGIKMQGQSPVYVLDGLATPGFSGSPLIFRDNKTGEMGVAGVVTAYFVQPIKVLNKGKESAFEAQSNLALSLAYPIEYALDVIRANPVGAPVK